jgi:DNA adenine methylase
MDNYMKDSKLTAKPFVKWAGGKYRFADKLIPLISKKFNPLKNTYIEPMAGSGGFFFKYAPKYAYLSDINQNLITTYKTVRNDVHGLIMQLEHYKGLHVDEEYFYEQRKLLNQLIKKGGNELKIASLFIYLNKTCFNGLYRENSNGEFNVPVGKNSKGELLPMAYDKDNLLTLSKLLQSVEISCHGYENAIDKVNEGDFVYIDPPYIPIDHLSFTQYSKGNFGKKEHKELSNFCDSIDSKGAYFMLSNSDTEDTRDIYLKEGRFSKEFRVSRSIASKAKNRVKAKELIITNYEL